MKKLQLVLFCVLMAVTSCTAQEPPNKPTSNGVENYVRLVTEKSFKDLILEYKTIQNLSYNELAVELNSCTACVYLDCTLRGVQLQNAVMGKYDGLSVEVRSALMVCLSNKIKKATSN
jgi:hypothetical protein